MSAYWTQLTETFNNRELAIGIWIIITFLCLMIGKKLRAGLWDILKALLHRSLLLFFGTIGVAVAAICWMLAQFSLWTTDQLPATLIWFVLSGCVMGGQSLQAKEDQGHFKGLFRNSIKLIGLFEFIVVAHSFSIITELVLVPSLVFIGLMIAVAETNPEHLKVKTLFEWILAGIVVAFLWNSLSQIWIDPSLFFTKTTGRNFLLPAFLTIGCIPVFYVLYCYSHIQFARIQIDQKTFQSDDLKRYARKRFFLTFMLRPWLLKRATRQFHTLPAKENADVDQIIKDILNYERTNEAPPEVDASKGWSPYLARDFLTKHGLRTTDYHKGFDEEYWASSDLIKLDDHILASRVAFYIKGQAEIVKTCKLEGKFRGDFDTTDAMIKLRSIANALCLSALGENDIDFDTILPSGDAFELTVSLNGTTLRAWAKRYPLETGYEVFFTLDR